MDNFPDEKTEEEMVELVADAMSEAGFSAGWEETGGCISCVILERKDGGEIIWGTADFNWGASIVDDSGETISSISTDCPSESQDVEAIVAALKGPSIEAGAVFNAGA